MEGSEAAEPGCLERLRLLFFSFIFIRKQLYRLDIIRIIGCDGLIIIFSGHIAVELSCRIDFRYKLLQVIYCTDEELFSWVDLIESGFRQRLMQSGFQTDRIVRKDEAVHIIFERNARIAQFIDAIHWIKASGHPNFKDVISKCT